jgi:cell division protein FtsB
LNWRRIRKRAVEATIVGELSTDARREDDRRRRAAPDPEAERARRRNRRAILLFLGALFLAGSVMAMVGKGGYLELRRLRNQRDQMQAEVDAQQRKVEALQRQVQALRDDPAALERIAREELGYARPGEVTFLLADPEEE